ncbi:MAG: hypothetical protein ACREDR_49140, partial [Blastocatellia bacterium]
VPPLLARAVAKSVMAALGVKAAKGKGKIALGDAKLANFNMSEAARFFGVDAGVIAPRKRTTSLASSKKDLERTAQETCGIQAHYRKTVLHALQEWGEISRFHARGVCKRSETVEN